MSCTDSAPDDGANTGDDASLMTLDVPGRTSAGLAVTIPDGGLADSNVALTIEALSAIPRGAVRAWELGPDGTQFTEPVVLEADYGSFELPPGVDADSLRLSVYVDERWLPLADSANDLEKKLVRATTTHFSIYGLVPDPKEVNGRGLLWEANGVTLTANAEHFARLSVSPTAISVFLSGEQSGSVEVGLSGLPTQGTHHLYVDGLEDHRMVTPADGGQVVLNLEGARAHSIWIQPSPGTVHIGGIFDQCASVGSWTGNVCTLTTDVVGGVSVEAPDVVLDCAGHRISQEFADRGMGVGVAVTETRTFGFPSDVTIRNCVIGGTDQEFWQGVRVFNGASVRLLDSELEYNGLKVISGWGLEVVGNTFLSHGGVALAISEDATNGEVSDNVIVGRPEDELRGIQLYGMVGESGPLPVSGMSIHDNTLTATVGIFMKRTSDSLLVGNELTAWTGIEIESSAGPNRFWWNNVEAQVGVVADSPVEISDGEGRGNWWGHDCPEVLFVAGVDSNDVNVVDSFPYGRRDAWEVGLASGCDVMAPEAPTIDSSIDGTIYVANPVIVGVAEPYARVVIYEGTSELGSTEALDSGEFVAALVPLNSGLHTIHATAIDISGNESQSSEARSLERFVIDETNPISGEMGRFDIIDIDTTRNPFLPAVDSNKVTLTLEVKSVKGLGGSARNHRFFVIMEDNVLDPDTLEPLVSLYGATEIDGSADGPIITQVDTTWDGRDVHGTEVAPNRAYPSDIKIAIVRVYVGPGHGHNYFTLSESLTAEEAKLLLWKLNFISCPGCPTPNPDGGAMNVFLVDIYRNVYDYRHTIFRFDRGVMALWKDFDAGTDSAENCAEAYAACKVSGIEADHWDFQKNACQFCLEDCDKFCSSGPGWSCKWPDGPAWNTDPCQYWLFDTSIPPPYAHGEFWQLDPVAAQTSCRHVYGPDEHDNCVYSCSSEPCYREASTILTGGYYCYPEMNKVSLDCSFNSLLTEECFLSGFRRPGGIDLLCDYTCPRSGRRLVHSPSGNQATECWEENPMYSPYP